MAVCGMQKIYLCVWKKSRGEILDLLQRRGTVQIRGSDEEDRWFRKKDTSSLLALWGRRRMETEEALEILKEQVPEKGGILDPLKGRREIPWTEYRKLAAKAEELLELAGELRALQKEREGLKAETLKLQADREALAPWMKLDTAPACGGTASAELLIGTLPGLWSKEQILEKLGEDGCWEIEILDSDPSQTALAMLALRSCRSRAEEALRSCGFVRTQLDFSVTPAEQALGIRQKEEENRGREEEIGKRMGVLAKRKKELQFLADYCGMQEEKYRILGQLLQSEHITFLSGYTPEKGGEKLKRELEQRFECAVELEPVPREEEMPVLLENNLFAEPVEGVVESYGLPGKGEMDPSSVMAFFYYFFFGLMLSDAGYGIVMVAGCLLALKKFPGMAAGTKKMLTMFLYCGISTTVWGILFGGYFGDVIPIAARTFFHREVTVPALWFAPLNDPMKLLLFSFLFGIVHLFTGLAIKGFLLLREGKYLDCLCEVGFWYLFLAGLILMLLPSGIFASMAGTAVRFPGWLQILSRVLAVLGALGIVFMAGRRKKNFGLRLALGAYELYGVTSWLSDVLSYSRLLALGIATGVIASVINTMAAMAGGGVVGAVVFLLVFLAGHTLNLAINLLGAYVHTNRLQYVEFFGKFYEGNGEAFRPFSHESNRYFKVKEEK